MAGGNIPVGSQPHRRLQKEEEEDADVLKLGTGLFEPFIYVVFPLIDSPAEFNNAGCFFISEVKSLLELRAQAAPDTP